MYRATGRHPNFERTSKVVARSLGVSVDELHANFRQAQAEDLAEIVALRVASLGTRVRWNDTDYLRWRYGLAPEGSPPPAFSPPCVLQCLRLRGRLIGVVGHEVSAVQFDGRPWTMHRGMDVMIDPEIAESGVGVWLSQAMIGHGDMTLAVGANENSQGMIQRLYSGLAPRHPYLLPLDMKHWAARLGLPSLLARGLGGLINALVPVLDWWHRPAPQSRLALKTITRFDEALLQDLRDDQLGRARLRSSLEVMRSADLLNWRLFENPRAYYDVVGAFEGERCVGYMAYRKVEGPLEARVMHIIDWLCVGMPAPKLEVFNALLEHVINLARRDDCASVMCVLRHAATQQALSKRGFMVGRDAPYLMLGVHVATEGLRPLLDHPEAWSITDLSFDNDGCY